MNEGVCAETASVDLLLLDPLRVSRDLFGTPLGVWWFFSDSSLQESLLTSDDLDSEIKVYFG